MDGGNTEIVSVWDSESLPRLCIDMLMPGLHRFYKLTQWYRNRNYEKTRWCLNNTYYKVCELENDALEEDTESFTRVAWGRLVYGDLIEKLDLTLGGKPWDRFGYHESYYYSIQKMPVKEGQ